MIHICKDIFKAHNRRYQLWPGKLNARHVVGFEVGRMAVWRMCCDRKGSPFSLKVEEDVKQW